MASSAISETDHPVRIRVVFINVYNFGDAVHRNFELIAVRFYADPVFRVNAPILIDSRQFGISVVVFVQCKQIAFREAGGVRSDAALHPELVLVEAA